MSDVLKKYSIVIGADTKELMSELKSVEKELKSKLGDKDLGAGVRQSIEELTKQIEIMKSNLNAAKNEINNGINKINTDHMKGEFKELKVSIDNEINSIQTTINGLKNSIEVLNQSSGLDNLSSGISKTLNDLSRSMDGIYDKFKEFQGVFSNNGTIVKVAGTGIEKVVENSQRSLTKGLKEQKKIVERAYKDALDSINKVSTIQSKGNVSGALFEGRKATVNDLIAMRSNIKVLVSEMKKLPDAEQVVDDLGITKFSSYVDYLDRVIERAGKTAEELKEMNSGKGSDVYVRWKTEINPDETAEDIINKIDKHYTSKVQSHLDKNPLKFKGELDKKDFEKNIKDSLKEFNNNLKGDDAPKLKVGIEVSNENKTELEKFAKVTSETIDNAMLNNATINGQVTIDGGSLNIDSEKMAQESTLQDIKSILSEWKNQGTPGVNTKTEIHEEKKAEDFINKRGYRIRKYDINGIATRDAINQANEREQSEKYSIFLNDQLSKLNVLKRKGVKRISSNMKLLEDSEFYNATIQGSDGVEYAKYSTMGRITKNEWQQYLKDSINSGNTNFFKELAKGINKKIKSVNETTALLGVEHDKDGNVKNRGSIAFGKNEIYKSTYSKLRNAVNNTLNGSIDENGIVTGSLKDEGRALELLKKKRQLMQEILILNAKNDRDPSENNELVEKQKELATISSIIYTEEEYENILAKEKKDLDALTEQQRELQEQKRLLKVDYDNKLISGDEYNKSIKDLDDKITDVQNRKDKLQRDSLKNITKEEEQLESDLANGSLTSAGMDRLIEIREMISKTFVELSGDMIEYSKNNISTMDELIAKQQQVVTEMQNSFSSVFSEITNGLFTTITDDRQYKMNMEQYEKDAHELAVLESSIRTYDNDKREYYNDYSKLTPAESERYRVLVKSVPKLREELNLYKEIQDMKSEVTGTESSIIAPSNSSSSLAENSTYNDIVKYIFTHGGDTERKNLQAMTDEELNSVIKELRNVYSNNAQNRLSAALSSFIKEANTDDLLNINSIISEITPVEEHDPNVYKDLLNTIGELIGSTKNEEIETQLKASYSILNEKVSQIESNIDTKYKVAANAKITERIKLLENRLKEVNKIISDKRKQDPNVDVSYYENQKSEIQSSIQQLNISKNISATENSILNSIKEKYNLDDETVDKLREILEITTEIEKSNNRLNSIQENSEKVNIPRKYKKEYEELIAQRDRITNNDEVQKRFNKNKNDILNLQNERNNIEASIGLNGDSVMSGVEKEVVDNQTKIDYLRNQNREFEQKILTIANARNQLFKDLSESNDKDIDKKLRDFDTENEDIINEYKTKISSNNRVIGKSQKRVESLLETMSDNGYNITKDALDQLSSINNQILDIEQDTKKLYETYIKDSIADRNKIESRIAEIESLSATRTQSSNGRKRNTQIEETQNIQDLSYRREKIYDSMTIFGQNDFTNIVRDLIINGLSNANPQFRNFVENRVNNGMFNDAVQAQRDMANEEYSIEKAAISLISRIEQVIEKRHPENNSSIQSINEQYYENQKEAERAQSEAYNNLSEKEKDIKIAEINEKYNSAIEKLNIANKEEELRLASLEKDKLEKEKKNINIGTALMSELTSDLSSLYELRNRSVSRNQDINNRKALLQEDENNLSFYQSILDSKSYNNKDSIESEYNKNTTLLLNQKNELNSYQDEINNIVSEYNKELNALKNELKTASDEKKAEIESKIESVRENIRNVNDQRTNVVDSYNKNISDLTSTIESQRKILDFLNSGKFVEKYSQIDNLKNDLNNATTDDEKNRIRNDIKNVKKEIRKILSDIISSTILSISSQKQDINRSITENDTLLSEENQLIEDLIAKNTQNINDDLPEKTKELFRNFAELPEQFAIEVNNDIENLRKNAEEAYQAALNNARKKSTELTRLKDEELILEESRKNELRDLVLSKVRDQVNKTIKDEYITSNTPQSKRNEYQKKSDIFSYTAKNSIQNGMNDEQKYASFKVDYQLRQASNTISEINELKKSGNYKESDLNDLNTNLTSELLLLEEFRNEAVDLGLTISQKTGRAILDVSQESTQLFKDMWTGIEQPYARTKEQLVEIKNQANKERDKLAKEKEERQRLDKEFQQNRISGYNINGDATYQSNEDIKRSQMYLGMTDSEIELKDKLYNETVKLQQMRRKNSDSTKDEIEKQEQLVTSIQNEVTASERLELVRSKRGTLYAKLKDEFKNQVEATDVLSNNSSTAEPIDPNKLSTEKTLVDIKNILLKRFGYRENVTSTNNTNASNDNYSQKISSKLYTKVAQDLGYYQYNKKGIKKGRIVATSEQRQLINEEANKRLQSRKNFDYDIYKEIINEYNGIVDDKTKKIKREYLNSVYDLMEKKKAGSSGKTELELSLLRKNTKDISSLKTKKIDTLSPTQLNVESQETEEVDAEVTQLREDLVKLQSLISAREEKTNFFSSIFSEIKNKLFYLFARASKAEETIETLEDDLEEKKNEFDKDLLNRPRTLVTLVMR